MLENKRILVIITGSIAAYKTLELIRLLTKAGAEVEAVLTEAGAEFVTQLAVETLTGRKAHIAMWDSEAYRMNHIELSRRADLIVAAPATADFIAKMIRGEGDDLASTVMLAKNKPVILAPSMNVEMWENPAFRRNLNQAQADGANIVSPQVDVLACGEVGIGKMAEPATIFEAVESHFKLADSLAGQHVVITTGGTIERIDSVRYISNFSSGKQGNALARAFAAAGAKVSLISGNTSDPAPLHPSIFNHLVESAEDMMAAVNNALPASVFVSCAAVCDFKVANRADRKIKKESGLSLEFTENPDILASIGSLDSATRPELVIGFAAETDDLIANAKSKLERKGCDLIVANDVSGGAVFGKDQNQAALVSREEIQELDEMSKIALAEEIVSWSMKRIAVK